MIFFKQADLVTPDTTAEHRPRWSAGLSRNTLFSRSHPLRGFMQVAVIASLALTASCVQAQKEGTIVTVSLPKQDPGDHYRIVTLDASGNLYFGTGGAGVTGRLFKVTPEGKTIVVAGGGSHDPATVEGKLATQAQFLDADSVTMDAGGNLIMTEAYPGRTDRVSVDGTFHILAGGGALDPQKADGGSARKASLNLPVTATSDVAGDLFIPEIMGNRIRKVTPDGTITTVAGTGKAGFSGDGGPATQAELNGPQSVAVDPVGNLYIADYYNRRIRKVAPDGIITTVAGTGVPGSGGDGGPATQAQLSHPANVVSDSAGNLFIADSGNFRARKVTPEGTITTVAGTGKQGDSGDGGPATSARLGYAIQDLVDASGNLLIINVPIDPGQGLNSQNLTIRKVYGVAAPGLLGGQPFPPGSRATFPVPGDVNGDGRVDLHDATLALQAALGATALSPLEDAAADLNGDGVVDNRDVALVLRAAIGVVPGESVPFKGAINIPPIDISTLPLLNVYGQGNMGSLGWIRYEQHHTVTSTGPPAPGLTFTTIGSFILTAADGDTIFGSHTGSVTFLEDGEALIYGIQIIQGGTGLFAGALGVFTQSGIQNVDLSATDSFDGVLFLPH